MKRIFAVLVACVAFPLAAKPAAEKPPLRFLQDIPLPGLKAGDFDHFAVDLDGKRLFLTGEANSVVLVLDTNSNRLIHTISDVEEPHSMLFLPASKQLWVVAGGEGKIKIFNSDTYEVIDVLNVDEGADSSAYDSAAHRFYVITGGGDAKLEYSLVRVFDTDSRKQVSEIKIDSKNIEAIALEKNGPRIFANIRDKNVVGVIDRRKATLTTTWTLGDLHGNTPIAHDDATRRLFVVGRKPASMVVLDSETGKTVAALPTAEMTDDMTFDPVSKRIYVACTDFTVVYVERDADHYEELGRIPTGFRAKTAVLVPHLKRFYVAAPAHEANVAAVKVYEVQ